MTLRVAGRPIDRSGRSALARSSGHVDGSVAIFDRPPIVYATAAASRADCCRQRRIGASHVRRSGCLSRADMYGSGLSDACMTRCRRVTATSTVRAAFLECRGAGSWCLRRALGAVVWCQPLVTAEREVRYLRRVIYTIGGSPKRVRSAVRNATISPTRPSRMVRTSRPPGTNC